MKSAVLERQQGNVDAALKTLDEGIAKFPTFDKLYMIKGQIFQDRGEVALARETYARAVKVCPKSVPLWILASRLEEAAGVVIKARSLLEKARLVNPKEAELWEESVRVEERAGSVAQARNVLARGASGCRKSLRRPRSVLTLGPPPSAGLQECPTSGRLWVISIWNEPRPQRKTKAADALKRTNDDPVVIVVVARLFWADRKVERARHWFGRATDADKDLGDSWGWWYKFEMEHGEDVCLARCCW